MSFPTKPLSYDSTKIMLQHVEANLRFRLALQIPSIRKTEKCVPLKLDDLEFGNMKIGINQTTYQLSIYRQYPQGVKIPENDKKNNEEEKVKGDLDPFGFYDFSTFDVMTEGDVDARPEYYDNYRRKYAPFSEEEVLVESLTRSEQDMVSLQEELQEKQQSRDSSSEIESIQQSISWKQETILNYQEQLEAYRRKRDNILPPYTNYIQLSIDGKPVERVEYGNKKLYEASKYLACSMFEGRSHMVQVGKFHIWDNCYIFRLPSDLKIRIKQIQSQIMEFGKLDNIIDPSNYSNANVCIHDHSFIYEDFDQPNIRNAKKLAICLSDLDRAYITDIVARLENQWVAVEQYRTVSSHVQLIRNWMRNGKREGVLFSFDVNNEEDAKQTLKKVKKKFRSKITRDQGRSITLEMPNRRTQMRVYYERNLAVPQFPGLFFRVRRNFYWINFRVERI